MEEKEYDNIFAIPVNYTDSGKFMNGMFETRNAVEAGILVVALGYPLIKFIPFGLIAKVIIAAIFILPLAILALVGIDGDSFSQYLIRIVKYRKQKRRLHLRRVGYKYAEQDLKLRKTGKK